MAGIQISSELKLPLDLNSKAFANNKYAYYQWMRENSPVFYGKLSILNAYVFSRYEDCVMLLKDPRFVRDRSTITGGNKFPVPSFIPLPTSAKLAIQSMITEDDPDHKRLRGLVYQAFTRKSLTKVSARIEQLTYTLLNKAGAKSRAEGSVDLKSEYALPIPVIVIQEMMGVSEADMPRFREGVRAMATGLSGWAIARTLFWDLPQLSKFVRELIVRKRSHPGDDILTGLIQAEEDGHQLSEDEIVSMVFLIIVAGYETTVQLITNGVLTLLQHPQQLAKLRANPDLIGSAVEEMLRFAGPVHSTKPMYATEEILLHDVTIPRGATVWPCLGAANRDPAVFDRPEVFDIERSPNKHLGFGGGIHACLGAPLARIEAKIAIANLLQRSPSLRLAVDPSDLKVQVRPGWHTYKSLPVILS